MKNKYLLFLSLIFLFALPQKARASLIMGSDIQWEQIHRDSLLVTLIVYHDCKITNFNTPILLVTSGGGTFSYGGYREVPHEIKLLCPKIKSRCSSVSNATIGIKEQRIVYYIDTKKLLDANICDIRVSFVRCCRNLDIDNLKDSVSNFYTYADINICQLELDKSTVFNEKVVNLLAKGQEQILDYGGVDPDVDSTGKPLDSICYSFTDPLKGSYVKSVFSGAYSFDKPLYYLGFPKDNLQFPRGIKLDSLTGLLAFRTMKEETVVYTIKVETYRRGKKISEARREIQSIIETSPVINFKAIAEISSLIPNKTGLEVYDACAEQEHEFDLKAYLKGSGLKSSDTLTYRVSSNISTLKIEGNYTDQHNWSGKVKWTPNKKDIGKEFYIKLYTEVNTCPFKVYEFSIIKIKVTDSFSIVAVPNVSVEYGDSVCNEVQFSHNSQSLNYSKFIWQLNDENPFAANENVDTNKFFVTRDTNIIKTWVYKKGCYAIRIDTFIAKPGYLKIEKLDTILIECNQDTNFTFEQKIAASGGNSPYQYSWSPIGKWGNLEIFPSSSSTIKLKHGRDGVNVTLFCTVTDTTNCKSTTSFTYLSNNAIDYSTSILSDSLLAPLISDSIHCTGTDTFKFSDGLDINYVNGPGIDKSKGIFTTYNLPAGKHTLKYQQMVLSTYNTAECLFANINHYVDIDPKVQVENPIELCSSHGTVELEQFANRSDGKFKFSGDFISLNNFHRPAAQFNDESKYYYTYTDSLACTATDSGLIKISNNVSYLDLGIDTILCKEPNSLHKLPIPSNIKTAKGSWTLSKGVKIEHDSIQIPLSSLNNYKVEFIGFDSLNCQGIASREFTVNSRPDGLIDNSLLPTKLCLSIGDTLNLIASPDDGFWQINNDQIIQNDTAIVIMDSSLIGSKNYSYTIFRNGCPGTKNKAITLNPNPTILTIPDDTICYVGKAFTHQIKNPNPSGLYTGPRLVNNSGIAISDQNDREAEYLFQLFTTEGCTTETKFKILVNSANPIFKIKEDSIPTNTEVVLLRFDNNSYNRHTWYFGNGDTSMQANPKYEYKKAGNYTITHKIENNLCLQTDSQFIKVYSNVSVPSRLNVSLDVYPNPTDGKIQIHGLNSQADVYFYNLQGKQLSSYSLSKGNNAIDISNNAKGVYMYRIVMSDGKFQTGLIELR